MGQNKKRKIKLGDWQEEQGGGIVYSTNPDYTPPEAPQEEALPPGEQQLKVWLEKKGRGGKTASIIKGYVGPEEDLKDLAKTLKSKCGTGGSVKEGEIIIQGDHRDKILSYLQKEGYNAKKAGG